MKLTELDPRWLVRDGERIGFIFRSPTDPKWYQSCMLAPVARQEQWRLFSEAFKDAAPDGNENQQYSRVQGCQQGCIWRVVAGADFENISVQPSIDGSAGGLWHGFITNGEIK